MADPRSFVQTNAPLAAQVGQAIGVSPETLLAQWGLETGWGKSVIPGTNNLGNVKDLSGNGVSATDNMTGSVDKYRSYQTPQDFGNDFIGLLQRKYPNAMGTGNDAQAFAQALKSGGYAEDPDYVKKLSGAAATVRKLGGILATALSGTANAAETDSLPASLAARLNSAPASDASIPESLAARLSAPATQQAQQPGQDQQPAQPTAQTQPRDFFTELGRQVGLTARAVGHGVADAAGLVANPLNGAINALTGSKLQDVDVLGRQLVDKYTPAPENTTENVVGSIASGLANPANYVGGGYLSAAKTIPQMAARGAVVGGLTGAAQPIAVENRGNPGDFLANLAQNVGVGAAGGAVAAPVVGAAPQGIQKGIGVAKTAVGKAADFLADLGVPGMQSAAPAINRAVGAGNAAAMQQASNAADQAIQTLKSNGVNVDAVSPDVLNNIRQQVASAVQKGETVDPVALLRQADFQSLGMQGTVGQVTRDPMQYARELNLRGIDLGGGQNALAQRFNQQPQQLGQSLNALGAAQAQEAYPAGSTLIQSLQAADTPARNQVNALYGAARDASGRNALLDTQAFANAANDALDKGMLGGSLPANARSILNNFSSGQVPLNVDTAVQADSVLSQIQRDLMGGAQPDRAGAKAVGIVRDALNNAPIASDAGQAAKSAFDAARQAAAQRFSTIQSSPALDAALNGAEPDKFVSKYVLNGSAQDLKNLAGVLQNDPQALQTARSQIASYLQSKAFGANTAGDKGFSQEAYNRALNAFGTDKLSAFFTPDEVRQFFTIGRVGAYISSAPAGSAVNSSNTASALMNLFNSLKAGGAELPFVKSIGTAIGTFKNAAEARNALAGAVPTTPVVTQGNNALLRFAPPTSQGATGGR